MIRVGLRASAVIAFGVPAVLLLAAAPVLADAGPHVASVNSGSTTLTADTCAGCHRAHAAQGERLITAVDAVSLCLTCHGPTAAGATTNVTDGVEAGTTHGLRGGGFTNALMDTGWTGAAVSRPATSAHMADGATPVTMWGNGAIGSGPGAANVTLTCTDCHNPHGNATYRILRPIPNGSGAAGTIAVADGQGLAYAVTSPTNRYFGEDYGFWPWIYDLDQWCAQCHTRYDAVDTSWDGLGGPGRTDSGDPTYRYRHMTRFDSWIPCALCHADGGTGAAPDPLGVGGQGFAHEPVCQTCHVAHGSAALMGAYSGDVAWPDGATTPSGHARSSLLRLDNRGVCVGCHDPTR